MLTTYTIGEQVQYILINRESPAQSQNITTLLSAPGDTISLIDRRSDQFFVYRAKSSLLYRATLKEGVNSEPIVATPLLAYKTFSDDWLLYIRESDDDGLVDVRFKRGDKDIQIKQLETSSTYLLALSKLGSAPVMAISSPVENRAIVYNDPQNYLNNNPDAQIPLTTTVLRVPSIACLTISSDSRVVLGYSDSLMASNELDADRSYMIDLERPIDITIEPRWIDGQHLVYNSKGLQSMIDFDGSNNYKLVASLKTLGSFYTDNLDQIFTFDAPVAATETTPALPARLTSTSLLAEKDR